MTGPLDGSLQSWQEAAWVPGAWGVGCAGGVAADGGMCVCGWRLHIFWNPMEATGGAMLRLGWHLPGVDAGMQWVRSPARMQHGPGSRGDAGSGFSLPTPGTLLAAAAARGPGTPIRPSVQRASRLHSHAHRQRASSAPSTCGAPAPPPSRPLSRGRPGRELMNNASRPAAEGAGPEGLRVSGRSSVCGSGRLSGALPLPPSPPGGGASNAVGGRGQACPLR